MSTQPSVATNNTATTTTTTTTAVAVPAPIAAKDLLAKGDGCIAQLEKDKGEATKAKAAREIAGIKTNSPIRQKKTLDALEKAGLLKDIDKLDASETAALPDDLKTKLEDGSKLSSKERKMAEELVGRQQIKAYLDYYQLKSLPRPDLKKLAAAVAKLDEMANPKPATTATATTSTAAAAPATGVVLPPK